MNSIINSVFNLLGVRRRRRSRDRVRRLCEEIVEAHERAMSTSKELGETRKRALFLYEELLAEEEWDAVFARTTDAQVDKMIDNAKKDVAENGTISLAELKAGL